MPAERDLVCENGHVELDAFFKHIDDENPPCPECGATRRVTWAHTRKAPGVDVYKPVFHDGVGWIHDQDTFNATRALVAKEQGCKVSELQAVRQTATEISNTADDHRHRRWARDQKKGLDATRRKELREITRRGGANPLKPQVT